jgi:hypothetical protein
VVWNFSSLLLAAVNSTGNSTGDSSMPADVQGIVLSPPPYNSSTPGAGTAAAWLASGDWLVPLSILPGGGCTNNTSLTAPVLKLNNITMLVEPQSLTRVQQALCAVTSTAAAFPSTLDILKVCAGLMLRRKQLRGPSMPASCWPPGVQTRLLRVSSTGLVAPALYRATAVTRTVRPCGHNVYCCCCLQLQSVPGTGLTISSLNSSRITAVDVVLVAFATSSASTQSSPDASGLCSYPPPAYAGG